MTDDLLAHWQEYESQNQRANVEYEMRPSIVAEIIESLDTHGLGRTARRLNVTDRALYAWFPDLIHRVDNRDRFRMYIVEQTA